MYQLNEYNRIFRSPIKPTPFSHPLRGVRLPGKIFCCSAICCRKGNSFVSNQIKRWRKKPCTQKNVKDAGESLCERRAEPRRGIHSFLAKTEVGISNEANVKETTITRNTTQHCHCLWQLIWNWIHWSGNLPRWRKGEERKKNPRKFREKSTKKIVVKKNSFKFNKEKKGICHRKSSGQT